MLQNSGQKLDVKKVELTSETDLKSGKIKHFVVTLNCRHSTQLFKAVQTQAGS